MIELGMGIRGMLMGDGVLSLLGGVLLRLLTFDIELEGEMAGVF